MSDAPLKLLILGTGPLALAAFDAIAGGAVADGATGGMKVLMFIDTGDGAMVGEELAGLRVQGGLGDLPRLKIQGANAVFVACEDAAQRAKAIEAAGKVKYRMVSLRHPGAVVSAGATVGDGGFLGPLCVIGAGARVGRGVHIGAGAIIEPGATVGEGASIGAGAIVGPGVKVAPGTAVGLGEIVR
jgi:NDP-sugar pyrophosphorylase family protein